MYERIEWTKGWVILKEDSGSRWMGEWVEKIMEHDVYRQSSKLKLKLM